MFLQHWFKDHPALHNGNIFSPLPPYPLHVAVLACFSHQQRKINNGSLFLLKVIMQREQAFNLIKMALKAIFL